MVAAPSFLGATTSAFDFGDEVLFAERPSPSRFPLTFAGSVGSFTSALSIIDDAGALGTEGGAALFSFGTFCSAEAASSAWPSCSDGDTSELPPLALVRRRPFFALLLGASMLEDVRRTKA